MFCFSLVNVLFMRVLFLVWPAMAKNLMLKIGEKATMTQNPKFKFEDWGFSFTSFAFIKSIYDNLWLSLGQEAFVGCDAPDSQVVNMEGKQSTLLKYLNGNRPLVLSFGSCS